MPGYLVSANLGDHPQKERPFVPVSAPPLHCTEFCFLLVMDRGGGGGDTERQSPCLSTPHPQTHWPPAGYPGFTVWANSNCLAFEIGLARINPVEETNLL